MSQTNAEKRRLKKRKNREKRVRHNTNLRRNVGLGKARFRLDVFFDGGWHEGVMYFHNVLDVKAHKDDTERRRATGEEIAEGKIVDLSTGQTVMVIAASQALKGALPDKLAGNPSANKALIDNQKALPDNLACKP